jgi:hypothetical protein
MNESRAISQKRAKEKRLERSSTMSNLFWLDVPVRQGASTQINTVRKKSLVRAQLMHRRRVGEAMPRSERKELDVQRGHIYYYSVTYLPWPVPIESERDCTDPASTDSAKHRINNRPFCGCFDSSEESR